MMRLVLNSTRNRRAWQSVSFSSKPSRGSKKVDQVTPLATLLATGGILLASIQQKDSSTRTSTPQYQNATSCQDDDNVILVSNESNSEEERFEQCLAYHRCFLDDYRERWQYKADKLQTTPTTATWPLHIPLPDEVPALEFDLHFCHAKPLAQQDKTTKSYCQNLQFRLACYYLRAQDLPELQQQGFKMITQLAQNFHMDSMCMYGILLNEGKLIESDPKAATVFWRRAVDKQKHVQSMYELAVAFYTGEGVPESEELAVYYFEKAATMGHAGAAYMLGDCLLDGVGAPRDRAEALEWLVAAGELGHRGARSRVLAVLESNNDGISHGRFTDSSRQSFVSDADDTTPVLENEAEKWTNIENEDGLREVSVERRYTIGGGSGNPVVLVKRKTTVAQSRSP